MYWFAGAALGALSALTIAAWALLRDDHAVHLNPSHFHALGKLMLTFLIFPVMAVVILAPAILGSHGLL